MNLLTDLLIVCPLLFLAGLIDGISGGGGIISLPAYLMTGMSPSVAYGCNKMQSFLGTSASLFKYAKSDLVDVRPDLVHLIEEVFEWGGINIYDDSLYQHFADERFPVAHPRHDHFSADDQKFFICYSELDFTRSCSF